MDVELLKELTDALGELQRSGARRTRRHRRRSVPVAALEVMRYACGDRAEDVLLGGPVDGEVRRMWGADETQRRIADYVGGLGRR